MYLRRILSMNIVDVGSAPTDFEDWATTVVRFHGFTNLTTTRDECVLSPIFSCLGHQWVLELYPGGRDSIEGFVAVTLSNRSNTSIKVQYGYNVKDKDGKEVMYIQPLTTEFAEVGAQAPRYAAWRIDNFAPRTILMNALENGSLIIDVRMKSTSAEKSITQFVPTNPINKNVLKLFMKEETSDVIFEVGGHQDRNNNRRARTSTTFRAHWPILLNSASTLYEMCGASSDGSGTTTLSITDVTPDIFKHMLYYTYGCKLSEDELKTNAKAIIDACDKYGVVHLKFEAEASYVTSNEITMDNMMDNLLYADSKNLSLLKEAVMDYIVKNKTSIIGKVSFDSVPGSLVTDVLKAMARGEEQTGDDGEDESTKYVKMREGTLRKMLDEKGLDVDGSRESMIALLRDHNA